MNAKARTARQIIKARTTTAKTISRAAKAVSAGGAQSAKVRLVAAGISPATADRFAGAFSRGVTADGARTTQIKLRGRVRKTVQVKLYSETTFAARLAVYRPKDKTAAAEFAAAV